jgi:hypothetical protein
MAPNGSVANAYARELAMVDGLRFSCARSVTPVVIVGTDPRNLAASAFA